MVSSSIPDTTVCMDMYVLEPRVKVRVRKLCLYSRRVTIESASLTIPKIFDQWLLAYFYIWPIGMPSPLECRSTSGIQIFYWGGDSCQGLRGPLATALRVTRYS